MKKLEKREDEEEIYWQINQMIFTYLLILIEIMSNFDKIFY
jgi:hypothetical protein